MKNISNILSSAIALNNKSQKQVAKDLNVSVSAISSYCRGTRQPDLSMLIRLQEYLNIPIDTILSDEINGTIFDLNDAEIDLLGSIKGLNEVNRRLFLNYSKEILQLLHATQKKG